MIKKISSVFLVLAVGIFTAVCGSAADIKNPDEQIKFFKELGIAKEIPYSVTYEDYVGFLGGMLYDNTSLEPETIAEMTGMIPQNGTLPEHTRIKYQDAVKYSVIALGYKNQAEINGDYFSMAGQLGLTEGIYLKPEAGLTGNDAALLLLNMLDVEPMKAFHDGTGVYYEIAADETILSLNRGISEFEGIVTANSITGLTREVGVGEGYIEIDGYIYETNGNFDGMLGKKVCAYVKDKGQEDYEILYMYEHKNKELTVSSAEADGFDGRYFTYYSDTDLSKQKKLTVSPTVRVIYNGVFLASYENEDILPENGSVTFIENSNDNEYDVILVESFETIVVSGILSTKETIVNKFRFDGATKTLSLDIENEDHHVTIYNEDAKKIEFSAIKVNDILSVAQSRSTEVKVIKIYKSSRVIEGELFEQNTSEKKIKVNDSYYGYVPEFYSQLDFESKSLKLGKSYRFYFDYFDNVVYVGFVNENDYYIFYRCYEDDEQYYVMYMDTDEMWNTVVLAKNVNINGLKYSNSAAHGKIQYNQPQVAKLYFNGAGEIREIKFAELSSVADESRFIKSGEKQLMWRTSPKSFSGSVWTEEDTKIFVIPKDTKDREKYSVYDALSYLRSDTTYKFTAYDMDEYGFTPLISINDGDMATIYSQSIFLVTDVYETFVDDEAVSCVNGVFGEFTKYQLTGENIDVFADVKPGDVIKTHTDRKTGRVDSISKIISVDTDEFSKSGPADLYHNDRIITGFVKKVDVSLSRILIDCGRDASFRLPSTVPVIIYDRSERKCEMGSVASLTAGDKVVCRVPYIQFAEIIIVRD